MITKRTIEMYSNPPQAIKGLNHVSLRFFDKFDDDYQLITDSQDIEFWTNFVGMQKEYRKDITAALVKIGDGELIDIYFADSSAPYDLTAYYHPLDYYRVRRLHNN